MISESIALDHFHRFELLQACFLCYLVLSLVRIVLEMAHIRDIADIAHLVAEMLEEFEEHVVCDSRSCMAEVSVSVNRRSADIHTHMTRMNRHEKFLLMRKRICQI